MSYKKNSPIILFFVLFFIIFSFNVKSASIVDTEHNLSTSGQYTIKSSTENRTCIFCHTPHNSNPARAIWNHETSSQTYTLYDSEAMDATDVGQPAGTSKLCLSCHDGTVAIGSVLTGSISVDGTDTEGRMPTTSISHVGTDFSDDHPQDFTYDTALADKDPLILDPGTYISSLDGTITETMLEDGKQMRCTSCHQPHDNTYDNFLIMDNTNNQLCIACHKKMQGETKHENCIWCHIEHNATEADHIRKGSEDQLCLSCHDGQVHSVNGQTINGGAPITDVKTQITKTTGHDVTNSTYDGDHSVTESNPPDTKHVACVDCHNVHESTGISHDLGTNAASGTLAVLKGVQATYDGTPWVDAMLTEIDVINYEYELCLRCHSSNQAGNGWWTGDDPAHTNMDKYINPNNEAHHGFVEPGKIQATAMNNTFVNGITVDSTIYCSDCHCDDDPNGPEGPHGADHAYNVGNSGVTNSAGTVSPTDGNDYICYDCHDVEVYGPDGTKGHLS
jgi:predicted CXXCH cytochrome family protein